ncbi:ABC transporter permease [Mucilaginibacter sp.]|uniref:ABC transporter permease n=1 Tax=Mucilaginibacter sp. TaxID=1882438 RepID=UPI0025D39327|nr:ABC transporter permease [Mucilaginibacter sp.]
MIRNNFKIAWRNLWKHKRITIINITGLGIGAAAAMLIILWVQNEMSFDCFEPDWENIFLIKTSVTISKTETWQWENSPYVLGEHAKNEIPEVNTITRLQVHTGDLFIHIADKIISEKNAAYVDRHWFKLFQYNFVRGSEDQYLKNPFSVILTQSASKRYFGNQDPIGKVVRIDTNNYQVQGVVKDYPANTSFRFDMLLPLESRLVSPQQQKDNLDWGNSDYLTFIKLNPNSNLRAVTAKLQLILHNNRKDDNGQSLYSLLNLSRIHLENDWQYSSLIHGNQTIVNVFIILAALILMTACINYVNLTTARASLRSKEVSIRKIIGAERMQLFGQFMADSFLVSMLSLIIALSLMELSISWFRQFTAKDFIEPVFNPVVWIVLAGALLVSFLLNGIYPAILLSSIKPLNVFRGVSMLNIKDLTLRRVLVIMQFAISVVLIASTIVIYSQLNYVKKTDPGYIRSQVFTFTFPWWKIPHFNGNKPGQLNESVKKQLQSRNTTANVAIAGSNIIAFEGSSSGGFDWPGRAKDFQPSFSAFGADPDFANLMHLKIIKGRWFNKGTVDRHNVLLNETALKLVNLVGDPIGQRFVHQNDTGVIIGVVKDFYFKSFHDKIGPMVIAENNATSFYIKTTPSNTSTAIGTARQVWRQYFPGMPFDYTFLDDAYNNLYNAEQQQAVLITTFAVIAIFISALGLLGLAAFAAEQKIKEIGIRRVLGASLQNIVILLTKDFVKMVCIASVIAFPIIWFAMHKWLENFAYRISLSWWLFALAAGIALLIAMITVSIQSLLAAMSNPVKNLRNE